MSMLTDFWHQMNGDAGAAAAQNAAGIQQQTTEQNKGIASQGVTAATGALQGGLSGAMGAYDQGAGAQQPYANAGATAISRLSDIYGLNGAAGNANALSNFHTSPGYQWQLSQGQQGLDRASNARGGFYSGAALKGAADYNQNQANSEWGNYTSGLSGLAGMGQNAAGRLSDLAGFKANALLGSGRDIAGINQWGTNAQIDANTQGGAAQAGGVIGAANAHTASLNNLLALGGTIAGAVVGGPAGAAIGSSIGKSIGPKPIPGGLY